MLKSIFLKTAVASLMLSSLTASANQVVDLFTDNQDKVEIIGGVGGTDSDQVLGADIIGGERDIIVTAGTDTEASAQVTNNQLIIKSGDGYDDNGSNEFTVEVQWDGLDDSSDLNTTPGLNPVADFDNLNGFSATINNSDGTGSFEVTLFDTVTSSTILLPFIAVSGAPVTFSIPFAFFPLVDLSDITAITLKLTSTGNTDIRVAAINAVSAPSSLAVLGLGLLGFAGFARRKA
ncbi:PEP-CTERM sorting domain-containing protein [Paraglaciecola sp.]|uniref:PEP-CTERM sorting domain-containing protein n=1 Tax=Paraglaciecola sp. TaxID=1920173 RepID=UPI003EF790A4